MYIIRIAPRFVIVTRIICHTYNAIINSGMSTTMIIIIVSWRCLYEAKNIETIFLLNIKLRRCFLSRSISDIINGCVLKWKQFEIKFTSNLDHKFQLLEINLLIVNKFCLLLLSLGTNLLFLPISETWFSEQCILSIKLNQIICLNFCV